MSFDWPDEPTPAEIKLLLEVPPDFGMSSEHPKAENPDTWVIGPGIRTRDSDLLEESNADALEKALEEETQLEGTWSIERHSHWACGWVDQLCFQLLDDEGKITPTYRWLAKWFRALADYPCVDEEDLSRREDEATLENIANEGRRWLKDDAPESWVRDVWTWLWDNAPEEVESRDCQGGYPSEEKVREAMRAVGAHEPGEDDDDEEENG